MQSFNIEDQRLNAGSHLRATVPQATKWRIRGGQTTGQALVREPNLLQSESLINPHLPGASMKRNIAWMTRLEAVTWSIFGNGIYDRLWEIFICILQLDTGYQGATGKLAKYVFVAVSTAHLRFSSHIGGTYTNLVPEARRASQRAFGLIGRDLDALAR